ncbi:hypothetical protein NK6_3411 [Bradyrhizobium diazoefficiens]|uniref:Uncharacterized protein n=1 Tax=Bradyrhizobium diazoefficiens TaxID=1355477 RepID=A0A0E4BPB5_9BRAD|nr:hypothetical protein NK6_3411 [Bradyrhizobium diazoefficiens]
MFRVRKRSNSLCEQVNLEDFYCWRGGDKRHTLSVVPAKAGTHTARSFGRGGGSTERLIFAKHLPGSMGPGLRRDDRGV